MSEAPKVVALRGGVVPASGEPHVDIVDLLRRYLDQAERGEVDAVALAISRPGGEITTAFNTGPDHASFCRLTSALVAVQYRLTRAQDEEGEPVNDD